MSSGSTSLANRIASCADQPRFASTASTKSAPAAQRHTSLPAALSLQKAAPATTGRGPFADPPRALESVFAVIAVVHLADEAVLGAHPGDHGGALQDGVGAAAGVLPERNVDGHG